VVVGFGLALRHGADPAGQLHVLAPWLVGSLAGLTGIESVFLEERPHSWRATPRAPTSGSPA
jgi:hypothetical protein